MLKKDIDYRKDLKYVPHHKTGIKILDIHQLENLFPNCERLLQRIEDHREELQQINKCEIEKNNQYNLMYDNIFSIFGKRGAGKTSVMFTLKKILEIQNKKNIVLPIVMPEMIPEECSMIGWILSLLEEVIDDLEQKMSTKLDLNYTRFNECMYRHSNSLKREYEKVKELCFSQFYRPDWTESFSTALLNKERQTQNSFDFARKLGEFWELLRRTIKETSDEKEPGEPLIYIIFDDVDLLPEAVTTLLSTIIKYLSHPNIIVFVTADEELLYDVIENNMNEKLGKNSELEMYSRVIRAMSDCDQDSSNRVSLEYIEEVAQKMKRSRQIPRLYVDKVLPPSSRYYLKTYDSFEDRSMFIENVEQSVGEDTLVTLEDFFEKEIDRYIKAVNTSDSNFLHCKDGFIRAYFAFWGNTSRQLVNEALILHEFVTRLINIDASYKARKENKDEHYKEKYLKSLYECIYEFAYNSLTAMGSVELNLEEIKELLDELIVCKTPTWGIYLNYSYLRERVEEGFWGNKNPLKMVQKTICLCVLLYFLENILVIESKSKLDIEENRRETVHGRGILVEVLDQVTPYDVSLICKNQAQNVNEFLFQYEKILNAPEILMNYNLLEPRRVRSYLNKLPKEIEVNLAKYSRENPKWFKNIVKVLYFSYEGLYEIQKKEILLRKLNNPSNVIYNTYYEESLKDLRDDLAKSLSTIPSSVEDRWKKIKPISPVYENEIIINALNILDVPKVFENYAGRFKEIEKEVIGKMQKAHRAGGDYIRADIYRKISQRSVGIAARTQVLLDELEAVTEKLLNNYSEFKYYEILDKDNFEDLLDELDDYNIVVPKKIRRLTSQIPVSEMNKILVNISNELGELQFGRLDRKLWKMGELEDIYDGLGECISLALKSEADVERAVSIIIDMQQFKTLQKYYLWSYLEMRKENPRDMRIDPTAIPYKELYKQIKHELDGNTGTYLSQIIKSYVEEAVEQYINKLMEG